MGEPSQVRIRGFERQHNASAERRRYERRFGGLALLWRCIPPALARDLAAHPRSTCAGDRRDRQQEHVTDDRRRNAKESSLRSMQTALISRTQRHAGQPGRSRPLPNVAHRVATASRRADLPSRSSTPDRERRRRGQRGSRVRARGRLRCRCVERAAGEGEHRRAARRRRSAGSRRAPSKVAESPQRDAPLGFAPDLRRKLPLRPARLQHAHDRDVARADEVPARRDAVHEAPPTLRARARGRGPRQTPRTPEPTRRDARSCSRRTAPPAPRRCTPARTPRRAARRAGRATQGAPAPTSARARR